MIRPHDFQLGSLVSFELHPFQILGPGHTRAKVLAILDHETASRWIDVAALHANIYPTLPSTTPNDYRQYPYVKLRLSSGEDTCVGLPWIVDGSLVTHTNVNLQFTMDNVEPEDQDRILAVLAAAGYKPSDIKVVDIAPEY